MTFENRLLDLLFGLRRVKQDENDTETLGTLYRRTLTIAWPAALEGLLLTLMNSFDTMMVGKLGTAAITAVGLCGQPRMVMLLLAQALCVGTTAVVARRKGADNRDAAISCLQQSLVIIIVLGAVMTLVGYAVARPLLSFAGAGEDTIQDAVVYFRTISMAYIPNFITLCICAAQRGIGKTRITMVINMTTNIVNVILNYCLILGHFGFPALGVYGAAIATAIGTCAGSVMALAVAFQKSGYLSLLPLRPVKFDRTTVSSLLLVGSGSVAESVFMRVGFIINGKLIAGVSTAAYATNQIVTQVTSLTFTLGDGVSSACTALVGQSLGAGKKDKAKCYVAVGGRISVFMSLILILFTFTCRNWFPTLFSEEPEIIRASALCFIVVLAGIYPQNVRVMYAGCLRGAGDVKYVAMVSLISVMLLRPAMTWLFCYPLNAVCPAMMFGYIGAWISFDIDAFVRGILLTIRVRQGKWANIEL